MVRNSLASVGFGSRNIIKYYKLGKEKKILTEFLKELGAKIEIEAQTNWSMVFDKENETTQIRLVIPAPSNSQQLIEKAIKEAILSIGEGGKNPSSPTLADGKWGTHYASKISHVINQEIANALKKQGDVISNFLNNQNILTF